MKKLKETTYSSAIATTPMPFAVIKRTPWPFNGLPQTLALRLMNKKGLKPSSYIPYMPFFEDRSKHLSKTRYSETDKLVSLGLKPLEKTPSGRSSGDSGEEHLKGKYKDIDFVPPKEVQKEAEKGIELRKRNEERKQLPKGDPDKLASGKSLGGTDIGVARAVQLMSGKPLTPRAIGRMSAFFGRHNHEGSQGFGDDNRPSAGYVAHLLWGGDSGEKWANEVLKQMEKADKAHDKKA